MSKDVIFKDIPGWEGEYQVSNIGEVYSLKSNKILKQYLRGRENRLYYYVSLSRNGIHTQYKVSRLVAMSFLPNPNNLPLINHKDENKLNNNVDNLEWCDYEYNNNYGNRKQKMVETRKLNGNCVFTIMCDKNTKEPIKTFESTRDAIKFLNLKDSASGNISAVIKGRKKSAYGYFWKTEKQEESL